MFFFHPIKQYQIGEIDQTKKHGSVSKARQFFSLFFLCVFVLFCWLQIFQKNKTQKLKEMQRKASHKAG